MLKPLQFDPTAFGFSIGFTAGNLPTTKAGINLPFETGQSGYSSHIFNNTNVRANFIFEATYSEAIDDLQKGAVSLYCNGNRIASGFVYLPYANLPDGCIKKLGTVIDGTCQFKNYCMSEVDSRVNLLCLDSDMYFALVIWMNIRSTCLGFCRA